MEVTGLEINWRFCRWCGQPFEPKSDGQRYCGPECTEAGEKKARHDTRMIKNEKRFADGEMAKIKKGTLDQTLEKARTEGKTYAQVQIERTLELSRKGLI